MAVIDIGPGATNRASYVGTTGYTYLCVDNPADGTGTLDTFEVWANANMTACTIGTYSGSGPYTLRDYESLGSVTAGSKQTFTGKNCTVSYGDYLAGSADAYFERDTSGAGGMYSVNESIPGDGTLNTGSLLSGDAVSIYATGATAAAGNPYYYYLQQ